jgi:hypothetical protein
MRAEVRWTNLSIRAIAGRLAQAFRAYRRGSFSDNDS